MITFFLQMRRTLRVLWSIFKDDETRGIAGVTAVLLLSGTLFYANVEHFTYLDALYFSFTTLTTIGYGDIYPGYSSWKDFYHDVFSCRIRGYGEFSSCCG